MGKFVEGCLLTSWTSQRRTAVRAPRATGIRAIGGCRNASATARKTAPEGTSKIARTTPISTPANNSLPIVDLRWSSSDLLDAFSLEMTSLIVDPSANRKTQQIIML